MWGVDVVDGDTIDSFDGGRTGASANVIEKDKKNNDDSFGPPTGWEADLANSFMDAYDWVEDKAQKVAAVTAVFGVGAAAGAAYGIEKISEAAPEAVGALESGYNQFANEASVLWGDLFD